MILLAHPFGNANVRAVLGAFHHANLLAKFITTVGYARSASWLPLLPRDAHRRSYDLPSKKIKIFPVRETMRLLAGAARLPKVTEHERGWASIDRVWQKLDADATRWFCAHKAKENITAVYAYEDCALRLFENARTVRADRVPDVQRKRVGIVHGRTVRPA